MADEEYLKPVDYQGQWQLPGGDAMVRGKLAYTRDRGIEVELDAVNQEEYFSRLAFRSSSHDAIRGEADYGLPITLLDCQYYGSGIFANRALVGISLESADDSAFTGATLHVPALVPWALSGRIALKDDKSIAGQTTFSLCYTPRDPLVVAMAEGRLEFGFGCVQKVGIGLASLQETGFIRVQLDQTQPLSRVVSDYVDPLLSFVSFAIGQPAMLAGLEMKSPRVTRQLPSGREYPRPLEVLFRPTGRPLDGSSRLLPNALLRLADVEASLADIVRRWLELQPDVHLAMGYLISNRGERPGLLEHRFLSALLGAESLHRAGITHAPDLDRHKAKVETILKAVEARCPEHRKWVKGRVKRLDEPGLDQRLRGLLNSFPRVAALVRDRRSFVERVVNTRTFLAHGLRREPVLIDDRPQLLKAVSVLEMLIESQLLARLSDANGDLPEAVTRTQRYALLQAEPL